ncbi:hypothetical protein chiPu_0028692, partial [Chiloscyllium punctatum]|nr:hypothetical protein [Chiloscyllium punctatum]
QTFQSGTGGSVSVARPEVPLKQKAQDSSQAEIHF